MKKRCFIGKLLFLVPVLFFLQGAGGSYYVSPLQAGEPEGLTLPQAVDTALRNNPLIQITLSGRKIADAQLREARAGWFPLLQLGETVTRGNNPVFVFGSLLEQSRFTQQNFRLPALNNPDALTNFRTALTLRQALFDQLQTYTRVAQALLGQQQADLQKAMVDQQVRFETIRVYYGVRVAYSKKEVADEAVRMAESDLKRVEDRFKAGLVVESDLLAARVQLGEFQQQRIDAEGDVTVAYAALNTVLGLPVDTAQRVTGEMAKKRFEPGREGDLLQLALTHRPDYTRAGLAVEQSREGVRGAKREYLPRIDVMGTYGGSGKDLSSGSSDWTISAGLTFNLFDAGRGARISKALAAESMASAEQQNLGSQIRLEVVRAYRQFVSSRERLTVAEQMIDQAAESHRIVQNRYREGLTTITEVLRAETALVRARLNLVAARYDYYVSYAHVLLSCGKLTDIEAFVS